MLNTYRVLILGASYGSLLATKLVLAGHTAKLVCLPVEVELINREGTRVRLPAKGRDGLVEVDSRNLPGSLSADTPEEVSPSDYDLVVPAMQEPQYSSTGVRELPAETAQANVPCMSIMNMPPLPYLERIPGLDVEGLKPCYTDPGVWNGFDPTLMTLCSPDPQAFRPPEEGLNVLQVSLPTNFKSACFGSDEHTVMLRQMQSDIEASRFDDGKGEVELPVKLKVHDSVFVPLAKWSMLLTGNYRCVGKDEMISIRDAVHGDLDLSRSVYHWVNEVVRKLGSDKEDQVPFEKIEKADETSALPGYANAAKGLVKPSSAARALLAGAQNIERADCLVNTIAAQLGMHSEVLAETVAMVDSWLERNRRQA